MSLKLKTIKLYRSSLKSSSPKKVTLFYIFLSWCISDWVKKETFTLLTQIVGNQSNAFRYTQRYCLNTHLNNTFNHSLNNRSQFVVENKINFPISALKTTAGQRSNGQFDRRKILCDRRKAFSNGQHDRHCLDIATTFINFNSFANSSNTIFAVI